MFTALSDFQAFGPHELLCIHTCTCHKESLLHASLFFSQQSLLKAVKNERRQVNEKFHKLERVYRDCIKRTRDKTRIIQYNA